MTKKAKGRKAEEGGKGRHGLGNGGGGKRKEEIQILQASSSPPFFLASIRRTKKGARRGKTNAHVGDVQSSKNVGEEKQAAKWSACVLDGTESE